MADTWYPVQRGDSLTSIAKKFDVTEARLMRANPWIINPNYIAVGMPMRIPSKKQNPRVTSLYGGAKDLKNGATQLLVEFELPEAAGAAGWIVQQVDHAYDIRKPDGSIANPRIQGKRPTYWEAWPVNSGDTKTSTRDDPTADGTTYDDSFDQPDRSGTKGSFTVRGIVKFYEMDTLPPEFKKQNPLTRAEDLFSSATKPAFWDGTGTVRDFEADWDATSGPCTTTTLNFVRVPTN